MPITATKKKKDGLQQYRVRVNYTDVNGNYKSIERTAYGKSEAQELERQLNEIAKKKETASYTVYELYDEYIKSISQEIRETTLNKKIRDLNHYVLPVLGKYKLEKLNTQILSQWKDGLSENDINIITKQNQYKQLRAMLNFAVKRGYLLRNPLDLVGNFKNAYFETVEEKIHFYTPDEYLKFSKVARDAAEEKNTIVEWGYYVFFSIAFYTGARKGEINALKWIDIDGDFLQIRRSIAQKLKGDDRVTPPKNKSSYRTIQIPQPLKEILEEHHNRHKLLPLYTEEWYICGADHALRDTSIEKRNIEFSKAAGLHHIRIHDFRHSHASVLCNNGINIQEIARRLGHSNVQMTWNTYSHMYPREEERALHVLDKIK